MSVNLRKIIAEAIVAYRESLDEQLAVQRLMSETTDVKARLLAGCVIADLPVTVRHAVLHGNKILNVMWVDDAARPAAALVSKYLQSQGLRVVMESSPGQDDLLTAVLYD